MYAQVAVARPIRVAGSDPAKLGDELTYSVPAPLGELRLGHVVLVPLGNQGETGYVVGTTDQPSFDPAKIKPVSRLLDPVPAFDDEQLSFFRWIADYYLVPLGMVIHTALPSGFRAKVVRVLAPTDDGLHALTRRSFDAPADSAAPPAGAGSPVGAPDTEPAGPARPPGGAGFSLRAPEHEPSPARGKDLDQAAAQVLREVVSRPGLTRRGLQRRLAEELEPAEVDRRIEALVRAGHATWVDKEVGEAKGRVRTVARVPTEAAPPRGSRMVAILASLDQGPRDVAAILAEHGDAARASLTRLVELGHLVYGEREVRDDLADAPARGSASPPPLNADQQAALAALTAPDRAGTWLLFGVTGAGKTEVFLGAASATLERGQQVLVLVPEIGLTPQLVGRFRARFGERVAVLHSGLTGGERLAQWRRIRAGEASVAVGARSALFAPFADLGLVVVDEEHDDSYKQDEGVPYHARDLAVVLGSRRKCPVVLASATPSLESWYNALQGRYRLLTLPNRATPRPVPDIELVDMTDLQTPKDTPKPLLAPEVELALRDTFSRGGQAIVLYNRRGYATMVQCEACGSTYECPNCAISMTLHKKIRVVCCHYCGLKLPYTGECPVCHAPGLDEEGKGTERIEEQLRALFPDVAIGRMDADTTAVRGAHEEILGAFREGRTQLLVGTQIVAKGHDFPGVHTAVVVSADRSFRMPDFRSAERTAALLVQLAGRAGRGDVPGRVFVQTWKADHYVLQHLHDLPGFYDVELRLRATLRYPPFTRLVLVRLDGVDRKAALSAAEGVARTLRKAAQPPVSVLGPAPAALPRLVGRWRFQIVVRSEALRPLRAFLAAVRPELEKAGRKGIRVSWDVDPRNLM